MGCSASSGQVQPPNTAADAEKGPAEAIAPFDLAEGAPEAASAAPADGFEIEDFITRFSSRRASIGDKDNCKTEAKCATPTSSPAMSTTGVDDHTMVLVSALTLSSTQDDASAQPAQDALVTDATGEQSLVQAPPLAQPAEQKLLRAAPREQSPLQVATLAQSLEQALVTDSTKPEAMLEQALGASPLVADMSQAQVQRCAQLMRPIDILTGEVVVCEGRAIGDDDGVLILEAGSAEATQQGTWTDLHGPGDVIGALELLYGTPHQTTVTCLEPCRFWLLSAPDYMAVRMDASLFTKDQHRALLRDLAIFTTLSDEAVRALADSMAAKQFADEEQIIAQGDHSDEIYVVLQGEVVCRREGAFDGAELSLGRGDHFGERALLRNEPRALSVFAKGETHVGVITRGALKPYLPEIEDAMEAELRRKILRSVPLLRYLTDSDIERAMASLDEMVYERGEKIVEKDSVPSESDGAFFIIQEGVCTVVRDDVVLKTCGTGEYFGERALLRDEGRWADVVATTRVRTLALSRENFDGLFGPLREILRLNQHRYALRSAPVLSRCASSAVAPTHLLMYPELTPPPRRCPRSLSA